MRKRTRSNFGSSKKKGISKKVWWYIGLFLIIFLGVRWYSFFQSYSKLVPANGGVYTEDIVGTFNNTNPLSSESTNFDKSLQKLIYSGLLEFSPVTEQYEPGLATFRISGDALTYTLTLRDSAEFSNGDSVTTEDVLFTFQEVIQHPDFSNKLLRERFQYVSISSPSDGVIEFKLPESNAAFLQALTTPILHKDSYKEATLEEILEADFRANRAPVGTGPFKLENIVLNDNQNSRVFLQKNEYYFKSKPFLNDIVFEVSTEAKAAIENVSTACINCFKTADDSFDKKSYELPQYVGLFFNTEGAWAQHQAMRRGLRLGVDKSKILEGNTGWKRVGSPFFFAGVEDVQYPDSQAARASLVNGGFKWDGSVKNRLKNGEAVDIKMIVPTLPPVFSRFAQRIAKQWSDDLGVVVDLQILDTDLFLLALEAREYDVVLTGVDFSAVANPAAVWHSQQSKKFNLANLTNETVDSIVREYQLFGAQSDLVLLHQKIQELGVVLPLFTPEYNWFVSKELKGVAQNFKKLRDHSDRFFGAESWHFNQSKSWDIPVGKTKIGLFFQFLFGLDS